MSSINIYYDLKFAPTTFDFAIYLVVSNAVRQANGFKTMGVTIVCDEFRRWSAREKESKEGDRRWRVNHILSKLASLIPEVNVVTVTDSPLTEINFPAFPDGYPPPPGADFQFPYLAQHLKQFYNQDLNLRPFKSSEGAKILINNLFDDNVITISLRSSKYQLKRNSNLDEWYKVYQELKKTKFRPIVIPCFEDYMGDKTFAKYDWEIFPPATIDLDLKLALYEKAFDNLCINNGVSTVLILSDCRYKYFKYVTEGIDITQPKHHKATMGINPGDNFPFAAESGQDLIWETDNADIILKALDL